MATGGIFTLITNDGRQDRMLMATSLLKKRLDDIKEQRILLKMADVTPTLVDIERTHILFMNAHFKPFAAIGYEYNKVSAPSGTASFGGVSNSMNIAYSIPQFGDFFHDMVIHARINQPVIVSDETAENRPAMRWCDYPGERILQKVDFSVNGNPLDSYDNTVYNFYREFLVLPHKLAGWKRCMGQESPMTGFIDQPTWANTTTPAESSNYRFGTSVFNGMQTPTTQKNTTTDGQLELFIPLLFWFNKDPRLSVPSVAIPYGQRYINVTTAEAGRLVGLVGRGIHSGAGIGDNQDYGGTLNYTSMNATFDLYINNIFVNPEIHDIFIERIGFSLIRVHRQQSYSITATGCADILLSQLKWPIECLFVGAKVAAYNSSGGTQAYQYLDRWHKFAQVTDTPFPITGYGTTRSYVIANINVSIVAAADNGPGTMSSADNGWNWSTLLQVGDIVITPARRRYTVVAVPNAAGGQVTFAGVAVNEGPSAGFTFLRASPITTTSQVLTQTLDTIGIKAHGIWIYQQMPTKFYNSYIPFHYGGTNVQTPDGVGANMIPFCLYPGTYQPSGHINVSRAREFYINLSTSVFSSTNNGTLEILASALNFLLISDGSAILRYST